MDRPAENIIENVPRDEPGCHENAETDIAGVLVLEILEDFGRLEVEVDY